MAVAPPMIELHDNFIDKSVLMWQTVGRTSIRVATGGGSLPGSSFERNIPAPPNIVVPNRGIQVPVQAFAASDARTKFNLYKRSDPGPFVLGDKLFSLIPNLDDAVNRGKVLVKVLKTSDLTFYYKLTTVDEAGSESVLADSLVRTVLSAEETQFMSSELGVKVRGRTRTFKVDVPDGTTFATPVVLDFVQELGQPVLGLQVKSTSLIDLKLNNVNNVETTLKTTERFTVAREEFTAVFRILFKNSSGAAASVEVLVGY